LIYIGKENHKIQKISCKLDLYARVCILMYFNVSIIPAIILLFKHQQITYFIQMLKFRVIQWIDVIVLKC